MAGEAPQPQYVDSADAFQQTLFNDVLEGHHVIGSFSFQQSFLPLYAFSALNLPGLTIVVCLNAEQVRLNCDTLSLAGVVYPEVASMDGQQTPQLLRDTYEHVNQRQTRLLYVTPHMLETLPFLQMMTHTTVSMVVIEEAQYLLPAQLKAQYASVLTSLNRLSELPPVCLLCGPVAADASGYFSALFPSRPMKMIQKELTLLETTCRVIPVLSQHQKFNRLNQLLAAPPTQHDNKLLPTLIITPSRDAAFQVVTALDQFEVEPVLMHPSENPQQDNRVQRDMFRGRDDVVVVTSQPAGRFFYPKPNQSFRVIYWQVPLSLEALFAWAATDAYNQTHLTLEVFYAKEDYRQLRRDLEKKPIRVHASLPLESHLSTEEAERDYHGALLEQMREFCLSDTCRLITLASACGLAIQFDDQLTCGHCDVCVSGPSPLNAGFFMKRLQRLLY